MFCLGDHGDRDVHAAAVAGAHLLPAGHGASVFQGRTASGAPNFHRGQARADIQMIRAAVEPNIPLGRSWSGSHPTTAERDPICLGDHPSLVAQASRVVEAHVVPAGHTVSDLHDRVASGDPNFHRGHTCPEIQAQRAAVDPIFRSVHSALDAYKYNDVADLTSRSATVRSLSIAYTSSGTQTRGGHSTRDIQIRCAAVFTHQEPTRNDHH